MLSDFSNKTQRSWVRFLLPLPHLKSANAVDTSFADILLYCVFWCYMRFQTVFLYDFVRNSLKSVVFLSYKSVSVWCLEMTYYRDFLICCCRVIWCQTVRKFTTTEGIFLDNFFDDKQPISHQTGVIWAVYLSGVILGVEMLYQRQTLRYCTCHTV